MPPIPPRSDDEARVAELKELVRRFCEERDWAQYHGPKDLAIGVATEAAELLAHFRFLSEEESRALLADEAKRGEVAAEMADVLYFLLRLSERNSIDLTAALVRKLEENARRYPVDRARGSNKKYTDL